MKRFVSLYSGAGGLDLGFIACRIRSRIRERYQRQMP